MKGKWKRREEKKKYNTERIHQALKCLENVVIYPVLRDCVEQRSQSEAYISTSYPEETEQFTIVLHHLTTLFNTRTL